MTHPFNLNLSDLEALEIESVTDENASPVSGGTTFTTLALGEEGGQDVTTLALGEEGGDATTTKALGEEGGSCWPSDVSHPFPIKPPIKFPHGNTYL